MAPEDAGPGLIRSRAPMLSEAQRAVYDATGRTVLAVGAVGSGKTHAAVAAMSDYLVTLRPSLHLICGRSPIQLQQTVRPQIEARLRVFSRALGLAPPDWNGAERILHWADHRLAFLAYTNVQSEARFRGVSAGVGLLEEATLCSEEFYSWLQTRLRLPGSRLYATANPEGPRHWLKLRIDDGRISSHHELLMDDNPALDPEVRADIERQYTPGSAFHRRAIQGHWAATTGLIFPEWETTGPRSGRVSGHMLGIDFGMTAPTVAVRVECRMNPESYWVTDELVIEQSVDESVPPSEQAQRIAQWTLAHPVEQAFVDPSAAPLIAELEQAVPWQVQGADNDVASGIALVARRFANGTLTLSERVTYLQGELTGYTWDERRQDTPQKQHDHAVDALRYAMMGVGQQPFAVVM